MKHHYVPQFLLRRWTGADGKLQIFAVRNGKLVCKSRTPEYTGYENDLYAIVAGALGHPADLLERKFFGPLDNNAAKTLEKLEHHKAISEDEHIAWTFFLSSLRIRQPDTLDFLRNDGITHLKRTLAEVDKLNTPAGTLSTEEWFNRNHPGALESKSLTSWLPRMILHDEVTERFAGLKWWFREFQPDEPKLLLSDMPLHWEGGFIEPEFMIHLPIAPDRLFLGTGTQQAELFLERMPASELIGRVNRTTLASSTGRIWASTRDEAQTFIESNLDALGTNVVRFDSLAPWATAEPAAS